MREDDWAENVVIYTLFECDPSRFGFGGSTEDTGMIILDIILWVGVLSPKMTFLVPNDEGGLGHQLGKVPKSQFSFIFGCGSPNNFLMSKENTALVVLLTQRQV